MVAVIAKQQVFFFIQIVRIIANNYLSNTDIEQLNLIKKSIEQELEHVNIQHDTLEFKLRM